MKLVWVLVIFLVTFRTFVYSSETEKSDAELERIWIERAAHLLENTSLSDSDLTQASLALDTASEFYDPGADHFYFRAIIDLKKSLIRSAYEQARLSLDKDQDRSRSDLVSFEQRAFLYAKLSLQLKEYRTYLKTYHQWPRGHQNEIRLLYSAARSALYLGLEDDAATMASRGEILDSSANNLANFEIGLSDSKSAFRALAIVGGDRGAVETLESAWRRWGVGLESALEPWILAGRLDVRKTEKLSDLVHPDLLLVSDLLSGYSDSEEIPGRYRDDLALAERILEQGALRQYFVGYTGTAKKDSEYDGIPEEQIRFINGRPDTRRIDADQDGRYDWEILYSRDQPIQIIMNEGRLTVNYDGAAYPEIFSMLSKDGIIRGEASFAPGALKWDPSGGDALFGDLAAPGWDDDEFWNDMTLIKVTVDDASKKEMGEAQTWLEGGLPIRAIETRYPVDMRQNPLWVRELLYEDGVISAGRRSFRTDPKNSELQLWELYERYEDGNLVGLAWDPEMNGSPAYLRDWALKNYLQIQVWDIDADGWLDVRRFLEPEGLTSSRELFITEAELRDLLPWRATDWRPWE